jgi:hypothetical protein
MTAATRHNYRRRSKLTEVMASRATPSVGGHPGSWTCIDSDMPRLRNALRFSDDTDLSNSSRRHMLTPMPTRRTEEVQLSWLIGYETSFASAPGNTPTRGLKAKLPLLKPLDNQLEPRLDAIMRRRICSLL